MSKNLNELKYRELMYRFLASIFIEEVNQETLDAMLEMEFPQIDEPEISWEQDLKAGYETLAGVLETFRGKSKEEQMIGIAVGLRSLFESGMKYSMKAKHYNDPYGYFIKKCASCAGCTRATGLCLNMLGYKYEHVNENQYSHQWARVKVGKQYWIVDAFGLYVGKEPAKRKHPYLS